MTKLKIINSFFALLICTTLNAQKKTSLSKTEQKDVLNSALLSGLQFRSLGAAVVSGRIADIAVNPYKTTEYYIASAAGGVWKTANAGITFSPVFDAAGASLSIGCVAIDPTNTNVVWVGTGENNNQRSVAYGDGVYKSEDGGKSWKNVGLKYSEHIGRIAIDPTHGDIVYVAAYGPLWNSGGDRGIYKTTDGGITWKQVLKVSEHTGFNEVMIDPRHPNIVYAAAHQRQRKGYANIGGGPESALYKSIDNGTTWNKMMNGLPGGDLGRIGLNISPVNPDILFCIIEAAEERGGVFKSNDRGAAWEKQNNFSTAGNYYQKIYCDSKDVNKIFVMDEFLRVSKDSGKNFSMLGEKNKHHDNHSMWIDFTNSEHYLVGCDGGVYESFDSGINWDFKANLPVTQFYRVSSDNTTPFYHIYGGTQDNFSLGVPSRTLSVSGITNADWYCTSKNDGYETQVDTDNPDIVYAQAQYGLLKRFDKKSGETLFIQPKEPSGEAYRWNWDAPLVLSKFNNKRLYHAANKLFRSEDRGSTWKVISPDLSRQIDRNKFPIMGKVWSMDAVAKNSSTDIYGNITSVAESGFDENTLYAGTDDGLIQITTDGGAAWTKIDHIAGVPELSYVNQIITSQHDKNVAYVTFNHHRYADFHPYVYKTGDGGKTWHSITGNLPERGSTYSIAEDHVNKDLLFVGTEFGLFVTMEGGTKWIQMKGGLPLIPIKDIEIQKRENDLILATFGRGFYVLDDYTPLRSIKKEVLGKSAVIFPIKDAWMFVESRPLGSLGKGFQGERFFTSPNPKVGAVFTCYLKDSIKTVKEKRREEEAKKIQKGEAPVYPSFDNIRLEDEQPQPHLLFTIAEDGGNVVRRIKAPAKSGLNRMVWDFRTSGYGPVDFTPFDESTSYFNAPDQGYLVLPGTYTVSLSKFEDGNYTQLAAPQPFQAVALNAATLPATDKKALDEFCKKIAGLSRVVAAADSYRAEMLNKLRYMKQAIIETPKQGLDLSSKLEGLTQRLNAVNRQMNGDASLAKREFETSPSINARIRYVTGSLWNTTAAPTQTQMEAYKISAKEFTPVYTELRAIADEINRAESVLEKNNAPYTPGRMPEWKGEF